MERRFVLGLFQRCVLTSRDGFSCALDDTTQATHWSSYWARWNVPTTPEADVLLLGWSSGRWEKPTSQALWAPSSGCGDGDSVGLLSGAVPPRGFVPGKENGPWFLPFHELRKFLSVATSQTGPQATQIASSISCNNYYLLEELINRSNNDLILIYWNLFILAFMHLYSHRGHNFSRW